MHTATPIPARMPYPPIPAAPRHQVELVYKWPHAMPDPTAIHRTLRAHGCTGVFVGSMDAPDLVALTFARAGKDEDHACRKCQEAVAWKHPTSVLVDARA